MAATAADGVLASGSVAELTTTPVAATTDNGVKRVAAYRMRTGDRQERVFTVNTQIADGVSELSVQPGRDAAVTTVTRGDG